MPSFSMYVRGCGARSHGQWLLLTWEVGSMWWVPGTGALHTCGGSGGLCKPQFSLKGDRGRPHNEEESKAVQGLNTAY